ncbi:MAG: sensor histidine kinase, partial [Lachnospiraceae bacterium]|nr:sensor histidine kinase [Lachnospiraceae bacterium]
DDSFSGHRISFLNYQRNELKNEYSFNTNDGGAKLDFEFVVNPTDASARMDEKWTMEAISNIVDNAIKYTNEGYVHINTQPYELFTRIDISDTGIGIPEVEQAQVFGRFYRSARNKHTEGVGIGLFLAREIISQEGGYIKLSSDETGTTFSVFLPRGEILQN